MVTIYNLAAAGTVVKRSLSPGEAPALPQSGTVWVDFESPTEEESRLLLDAFRLHPLAVEDALAHVHHPKIDDYRDYLFLIMHEVERSPVDGRLETSELDIFLGPRLLVTYHDRPLACIRVLRQALEKNPALLGRTPDFLLHLLLDRLVDSYLPVLDLVEERIDAAEDAVLRRPLPGTLDEVLTLKREVASLRRFSVLQREVLRALSSGEFPLIHPDLFMYYRDVYDHLVRISDLTESYRDLLTSVLEAHLTAISNRLNEVMKVLTIIATVMMPLTLITGVYGMNFKHMPLLDSPAGFWIVLGGMGALALAMLAAFRRAGWLYPARDRPHPAAHPPQSLQPDGGRLHPGGTRGRRRLLPRAPHRRRPRRPRRLPPDRHR